MGFKTNHKGATQGGFSIKPEGDYEVIIKGIEEKTTRNNKTGLNMKLLIRNDVPGQKFGDGFLFHTFWKRKEPTELDMQVEGYSYGQIMNLGKAARLPDGKNYENLGEYCADLIDKCIRVTLKHGEYNGKPKEEISWINETKFPDCKHVYKQSAATAQNGFAANTQQFSSTPTAAADISPDDDLPF